MEECRLLKKKLDQINTRIDEAEVRLGAHSIKPILMQQLFELEEERAVILEQLQRLKECCPACPQ
jgi:hypothetical protein